MSSRARTVCCLVVLISIIGCSENEVRLESEADLTGFEFILVYPLLYEAGSDGDFKLLPPDPHSLLAVEMTGEARLSRDVHGLEKELKMALIAGGAGSVYDAETADEALLRENDTALHCFLEHTWVGQKGSVTLRLEDHLRRSLGSIVCEPAAEQDAVPRSVLAEATRKAAQVLLAECSGLTTGS